VRAAAHLAALAGDYEEQRVLAEDALARWQTIGDQPAIAAALGDLAVAAMFGGDLDRAADYYERSRAAARAGEDDPVLALVTLNLADLQIIRGDYGRARELAEESAALSRRLGIGDVAAMSLLNLGLATYFLGDTEAALGAMREAAEAARTLGGDIVSQVFEAQAAARLRLGDAESAALLLGAADALRGLSGSAEQPFYAAMNAETRAAIRAALGEGADATLARGREVELDDAIALASR
jgi:tetratricopeptide (TPR) repeat protein